MRQRRNVDSTVNRRTLQRRQSCREGDGSYRERNYHRALPEIDPFEPRYAHHIYSVGVISVNR